MPSSVDEAFFQKALKAKPLGASFFLQPTPKVAEQLIGKFLVHNLLVAEIIEVEAYLGNTDPASHAYRGRTKRNWPMFETGGTCYVYLSYGVHYCMNVATGPQGKGEAVLFRALCPKLGLNKMAANRPVPKPHLLTNGPGKLTQALGIDLSHNGWRFNQRDFKLVDLGQTYRKTALGRSPRIGISRAKDKLLRFYLKESPWVSRRS